MTNDWARPLVHFEIEAKDAQLQRTFYGEMFNWHISGGGIMSFDPGLGAPEAGAAGHIRQSNRSGITLYIQVRDLAESCAKAVALGGSVVLDRLDVPNGPTLAAIADPEGNPITLVQQ
jgi:uncharacterized protein